MVSIISLRYGYRPEEILSKSYEWRLEKVNDIIRYDAVDKLWELKLTSMSHSPGTESGASKLSEQFRSESKELVKAIRRSNGEIVSDDDIDEFDGRMMAVDD